VLHDRGIEVRFRDSAEFSYTAVRPVVGATLVSVCWVREALSPGLEGDHSL
jgi:hypothetical protein